MNIHFGRRTEKDGKKNGTQKHETKCAGLDFSVPSCVWQRASRRLNGVRPLTGASCVMQFGASAAGGDDRAADVLETNFWMGGNLLKSKHINKCISEPQFVRLS